MDFKKFYFSPEGRVNRKQWWLWLVLPFTVIGTLLGFIDMATGNYNPEAGIGLFSGIFAIVSLIPAIRSHQFRRAASMSASAARFPRASRYFRRLTTWSTKSPIRTSLTSCGVRTS